MNATSRPLPSSHNALVIDISGVMPLPAQRNNAYLDGAAFQREVAGSVADLDSAAFLK